MNEKVIRKIKIFISHGKDTEEECKIAKEVIREESNLHYEKVGFELESFCWDDIRRGRGDPQEDLVDPLIKDEDCKLIIMVLWVHFGNPTPKYESGIEHEYQISKDAKKNMLIFFSNKSILPHDEKLDLTQLSKVRNFKKRIEYEREYTHCGLFADKEDFMRKLRAQLVKNIDKIIREGRKITEDFSEASRGF